MFYFWRGATAALVPGFLCQSGRRRPENVSILSSLIIEGGSTHALSLKRCDLIWLDPYMSQLFYFRAGFPLLILLVHYFSKQFCEALLQLRIDLIQVLL